MVSAPWCLLCGNIYLFNYSDCFTELQGHLEEGIKCLFARKRLSFKLYTFFLKEPSPETWAQDPPPTTYLLLSSHLVEGARSVPHIPGGLQSFLNSCLLSGGGDFWLKREL